MIDFNFIISQITIGSQQPVTLNRAADVYGWYLDPANSGNPAVKITADKPIMVAQFASSRTGSNENADPAMTIPAPASQVSLE